MEETELSAVRWFRLRLGDGEDFKQCLIDWAREHGVTMAWVQCLGELQNSKTASGYTDPNDGNPEKIMSSLPPNQHVMGLGTIIRDDDGERVHLHGPMGRDERTVTGCWAGNPETFRGMDLLVTVLEESEESD